MQSKEPLEEHQRILLHEIEEILSRVDALPTLDTRSPDEILGYDEHGLPRRYLLLLATADARGQCCLSPDTMN